VLAAVVGRPSGKGIVYSTIDVKKWAEKVPSAETARPACCSGCGAASRPAGAPIVLVSHGLRERQVRGPASASEGPTIRTIFARRYRCRRCGRLTTVLPRGLCARRHYSASAIGLSLCLFGVRRLSIAETRRRVCPWGAGFETARWTTLSGWLTALEQGRLLSLVRPSPPGFSLRARAERAAMTLGSLATAPGSAEQEVFEGAALAA
jgi:hypothetical protein